MDLYLDPKLCCVKMCFKESIALGLCVNHWRRNKLYGSPVAAKMHSGMFRGLPAEQRFQMQFKKTETCWVWTSNRDRYGYGRFHGAVDGVLTKFAHRYSYMLHRGPIPNGMLVCHSCDNPPCVNPDHLFLGSEEDNMRDKIAKGRHVHPFGQDAPRAVLTEEQVRDILIDPRPHTAIAADYGVKGSTIGSIKQRISWSHITDVEPVHAVRVSAHKGVSDKITPEIVVGIRASNESYSALAQRYGVSISSICDIRKKRSWAHVNSPQEGG